MCDFFRLVSFGFIDATLNAPCFACTAAIVIHMPFNSLQVFTHFKVELYEPQHVHLYNPFTLTYIFAKHMNGIRYQRQSKICFANKKCSKFVGKAKD